MVAEDRARRGALIALLPSGQRLFGQGARPASAVRPGGLGRLLGPGVDVPGEAERGRPAGKGTRRAQPESVLSEVSDRRPGGHCRAVTTPAGTPSWARRPWRPRLPSGAYSVATGIAPPHCAPTATPWRCAAGGAGPGATATATVSSVGEQADAGGQARHGESGDQHGRAALLCRRPADGEGGEGGEGGERRRRRRAAKVARARGGGRRPGSTGRVGQGGGDPEEGVAVPLQRRGERRGGAGRAGGSWRRTGEGAEVPGRRKGG